MIDPQDPTSLTTPEALRKAATTHIDDARNKIKELFGVTNIQTDRSLGQDAPEQINYQASPTAERLSIERQGEILLKVSGITIIGTMSDRDDWTLAA